MKIFKDEATKGYFGYVALFVLVIISVVFFLEKIKFNEFITAMENRTFDLRQSLIIGSNSRHTNKDIVLITIDDPSYEYLLTKYGEWPIPRNVYADLVHYLEKQKPKAIAFDLMFINSIKSKNNADEALVKAIKSYDNVYTSMNFDNQPSDVRLPVKLPKYLAVSVKNDSKVDFSKDLTFSNCRAILKQILEGTSNVGMINVSRSEDGILRTVPPFLVYQNDFYPHLTLLMGMKYLNIDTNRKFYIQKNSDLKIGDRVIPLNKEGGAILNWYGPAGKSFKTIPFYKVVKAMYGDKDNLDFDFKNKLIYIGTTAVSLYDAKSVPVDKLYPGVEVHTTYVNNFIDNSFIRKAGAPLGIAISLILAVIVGFVVFSTTSTFVALGSTILTAFCYIILTYNVMKFFNIWLAIIVPMITISVVFAATYIIKYILKSRDFEHQYRLATTDGLTDLYNHRFFQEQMIQQIANAKRYNTKFSMIIIDIDFFKKFNDIFGHQSGDAVLRQVAIKLKKNVRSADYVCRYGGEEMTIILPSTDKDEAVITAEKICQIIAEKPFKLANNQESKVTISLGVATFPQDGETPASLIEHADKCLYQAKENGRNQVKY